MKTSNRFNSFRLYMTPKVPPREGTRPTTSCRPGPLTRRRRFMSSCIAAFAAVVTCSAALRAQSATPSAPSGQEATSAGDELTWPREFEDNGTKVDIYQPQIEKWEGTDFETRSAVAVTPPGGSNAPIYGVFWMKARADVDKAARIVTL